jgi:hypothetical protein
MKGGNVMGLVRKVMSFRLEGFDAKLQDERSGSTVHNSGVNWIVQNWELLRLFTLGFCKLNISFRRFKYWRGAIFKNQKF